MTRTCTSGLFVLLLALGAAAAHPAPARAQAAAPPPSPAWSRVDVFGGFTGAFPRLDGAVHSEFPPPFLYGTSSTSTSTQDLVVTAGRAPGFEVGISLFPTDHAGVQVRVRRERATLSGVNGPYLVHLHYMSMPPPNYTPTLNSFDQEITWPDTEGRWSTTVLSFNGVVRARAGARATVTASGGLSWVRMSGEVQPLAIGQYWLGGHSVLFSNVYELAAQATPTGAFGVNVGGGVNIALARHVALALDARWLQVPRTDVPLGLTAILNESELTMIQTLDFLKTAIAPAPGPVSVNPSHLAVMVGVSVGF